MLSKIVYFDEGSVTDYVQIIEGGKLEKTNELLKESNVDMDAEAEAKASLGIGAVLKTLLGFSASISAEASAEASINTNQMAKNIIKNTILTDFIDLINNDAKKKSMEGKENSVNSFKGYKISVPEDSLSYIALISPYLTMLKTGSSVSAGEFDVDIEKLDKTIKNAKGYYEFVGEKNDDRVIFRFNIESFKNNYKVTDLMKMDVVIYAIKVGKSSIEKLNINNEFEIEGNMLKEDNPDYENLKKMSDSTNEDEKEVDVYDVLLAGVEVNDQ